jgi:hypothetical protein
MASSYSTDLKTWNSWSQGKTLEPGEILPIPI